ncbi:cell division control protein 12 [Pancytospora philotis]|nr:cell division control protein 12 [Pancytospora philotis]
MPGIGVSSLPKLRLATLKARGFSLNVMVAGSHGLGKTTLLANLFGIGALKQAPFAEKASGKYWYDEDVCNVQLSQLEVVESEFAVELRLYEVDNIGDCVNAAESRLPIAELLERQFADYEEQSEHKVPGAISDRRVHVCFYMLEPLMRIRPADIEAMKAVSKYCCLVPLVAKADLLDAECMARMRHELREQLDAHGVSVFDGKADGCDAPFFVVLGPVVAETVAKERDYPWGITDLEELKTNEFFKMREFVLKKSIVALVQEMQFCYDNYRTARLASYLMKTGKCSDSKSFVSRVEERRREIKEARGRIKQRQDDAGGESK